MKGINTELVAVIAVLALITVSVGLTLNKPLQTITPTPHATTTPQPQQAVDAPDLKTFKSWEEVTTFLKTAPTSPRYGGFRDSFGVMPLAVSAPMAKAAEGGSASEYSTTNIQVAGVDEADTVKNDGSYIYTISGSHIVILKAFPPSEAKVLSTINDSTYSNIFINGDKLVAFGSEAFNWEPILKPLEKQDVVETAKDAAVKSIARSVMGVVADVVMPPYPRYPSNAAFVKVYDVADRANPKLLKNIDVRGSYVQSRMIDSKVYAFFSEHAYHELPRPVYAVDGKVRELQPTEVNYFDYPFESYQFTTILGIDLDNVVKEETRKVVLMGGSQNLFVSKDNAYVTYTRYNYYYQPVWEAYDEVLSKSLPQQYLDKLSAISSSDTSEWRKDNLRIAVAQEYLTSDALNQTQRNALYEEISQREQQIKEKKSNSETTQIHKFSLQGDVITYAGKGEVPGHVLNQFSMDESNGYFRIATTVGRLSRERSVTQNNVYVLNASLSIVGRLEDLAPGESIYSARFMGNRAYLVTFKKVDPLFVIGLEDPAKPTLLGKLKIPGYSDYLHPYDENHLIGLGKDAVPAEKGDFAWYQGVKLSLFDVSDVSTPKEIASYKIGDRGTDSYALQDHKAFLFSKSKNLLVIPIRLAEIIKEKYPQGVGPTAYGEFTFQGAYVFNISLDKGFELRGRISHADPEALKKSGEYYYGHGTDVKRSLYMDEFLYTISDSFVKANALDSLKEKASVKLPTASEWNAPPEWNCPRGMIC